jgi:hypothetical protein
MSTPTISIDTLRYPIGKFDRTADFSVDQRAAAIATVASLPQNLRSAVESLNDIQLDTPYREGGWTVRQLVHHVADSHVNAYCRIRLALTEDWPTIKPYNEKLWAELADSRTAPIDLSLQLLEPLHRRWVILLESLNDADWQRGYLHPEGGKWTVAQVLGLYAWHCRHHTAHITALRHRSGW